MIHKEDRGKALRHRAQVRVLLVGERMGWGDWGRVLCTTDRPEIKVTFVKDIHPYYLMLN